MAERPRLFLLDGFALAYRAHYALIERPLRTVRGENTSVPYGVLRLLRKLLVEQSPEYLAFVLDAPGGDLVRRGLYAAYKATREKLDEAEGLEFGTAMARVRELLEALRVPVIEIPGHEADDVIGTLARQAVEAGLDAVIVSGDTDFYQLVGPHVAIYEPGRSGRAFIEARTVDREAATERMGVPPERVVDYLALVGDRSDNVPGAHGIGPKTATGLLERYGSLDAVLAHVDELPGKRARESLQQHAEAVRLSRRLVTIRLDVPVHLELESLRVREPDHERLAGLLLELEFHSLLHELAPERVEPRRYRTLSGPELRRLAAGAHEQLGLEVVGEDGSPRRGPVVGVAVAVVPGEAGYLPLGDTGAEEAGRKGASEPHPGDRAPRSRTPRQDGGASLESLRAVLAEPRTTKVGHDLKRALLALRRLGLAPTGPLVDPMIAAWCLDPTRRAYDLETLVVERFGQRLPERPFPDAPIQAVAPDGLAPWAATRADLALRLARRLVPELRRRGQLRLLEEVEMPLVPVLAEMEWTGVGVDVGVLDALDRHLSARLDAARREIAELAGADVNPDSPVQLREVLFRRLRLPVKKRTKTGPSTDADVLSSLAAEGHRLPARLLEHRELAKLKSTYVDGLRARVDPDTGRLHTSFNQTATATGRLSSSEPNLQNIPVRTELGASIRKAFVPAPGFTLLTADYSQIELRILAHLCGEPALVRAFREGRDVHRETAARVFGVPLSKVTGAMREAAKTVNYATLYGQGARSLARRLELGVDEAQGFIDGYFARLPGVRRWIDAQIEQASREGFVETLLGRRRYVTELRSRDPGVRGFGRRVAQNTPVQGSAADVIKLAMIRVHGRLHAEGRRSRLLLQVHDELVLEVAEDERAAVAALVRAEMEGVLALSVPLVVDLGFGASWHAAGKDKSRAARAAPSEARPPT